MMDPAHASTPLRLGKLKFQYFYVSFPQDRVVQVTLNRPDKLNCIDKATSREIQTVWELFDQDESLWVGIITGNGRAFCTGADLKGKLLMSIRSKYQITTDKD